MRLVASPERAFAPASATWEVCITLDLEAGQLQAIARAILTYEARLFPE